MPECQAERGRPTGQRVAGLDPDDARRVRERRDGGEQSRVDILPCAQKVDRFDAGGIGRCDEILALADEQALLLALPPRLEQAPNQL